MNFLFAIIAILAFQASFAQDTPVISGDAVAGKTVYETQCVVCHGPAGASIIPTQPILSGQHAEYTAAQLRAFRDGARQNAVMSPMSANLSDEDINNLAVYLANQTPVIVGSADETRARQAEKLYRGGNIELAIAACAACHGPTGAGIAPHFPRLSGQHAVYIASSLREFASNKRDNSIMNDISAKLTEEQIDALAAYISGLAP